jgi:probable F420-dependent oxidoreductase
MKIDLTVFPDKLKHAADFARNVERRQFDALWTAEVAHNPFLPLTLAAHVTNRLHIGTQIAVAFARSPMTIANIAWDLQDQSDGRFMLGLGTQVKAHIRKRFSMPWSDPANRLREYIEALRAIWDTWQNGTPLKYDGEHYQFSLMTPFFTPEPIANADIPIYIAGVNEKNCQLAGEVCQGLHAHGFHTTQYLKEVVISNVEAGRKKSGKTDTSFELVVPIFIVSGHSEAEIQKQTIATKSRIAFYASTPSYRVVLDTHGWHATHEKLSKMARNGEWDTMWKEISDEMLDEIAIIAPPDQLKDKIHARYDGIADRICIGYDPEQAWLMDIL